MLFLMIRQLNFPGSGSYHGGRVGSLSILMLSDGCEESDQPIFVIRLMGKVFSKPVSNLTADDCIPFLGV